MPSLLVESVDSHSNTVPSDSFSSSSSSSSSSLSSPFVSSPSPKNSPAPPLSPLSSPSASLSDSTSMEQSETSDSNPLSPPMSAQAECTPPMLSPTSAMPSEDEKSQIPPVTANANAMNVILWGPQGRRRSLNGPENNDGGNFEDSPPQSPPSSFPLSEGLRHRIPSDPLGEGDISFPSGIHKNPMETPREHEDDGETAETTETAESEESSVPNVEAPRVGDGDSSDPTDPSYPRAFFPVSAEASLVARIFPSLFDTPHGERNFAQKVWAAAVIAPLANLTNFSLFYQIYLVEIFHIKIITKLNHFLMIPITNFLIAAFFAQFTWGETDIQQHHPLHFNKMNGSFFYCCVLCIWYTLWGLLSNAALLGPCMIPILFMQFYLSSLFFEVGKLNGLFHYNMDELHMDSSAALNAAIGVPNPFPWYNPTGSPWSNPLVLMGISAMFQAGGHVFEPFLPPPLTGTNRWATYSETRNKFGNLKFLGVVTFSAICGAVDEFFASPRLLPIITLRILYSLGLYKEQWELISELSEIAIASGNPALDFIGQGGPCSIREMEERADEHLKKQREREWEDSQRNHSEDTETETQGESTPPPPSFFSIASLFPLDVDHMFKDQLDPTAFGKKMMERLSSGDLQVKQQTTHSDIQEGNEEDEEDKEWREKGGNPHAHPHSLPVLPVESAEIQQIANSSAKTTPREHRRSSVSSAVPNSPHSSSSTPCYLSPIANRRPSTTSLNSPNNPSRPIIPPLNISSSAFRRSSMTNSAPVVSVGVSPASLSTASAPTSPYMTSMKQPQVGSESARNESVRRETAAQVQSSQPNSTRQRGPSISSTSTSSSNRSSISSKGSSNSLSGLIAQTEGSSKPSDVIAQQFLSDVLNTIEMRKAHQQDMRRRFSANLRSSNSSGASSVSSGSPQLNAYRKLSVSGECGVTPSMSSRSATDSNPLSDRFGRRWSLSTVESKSSSEPKSPLMNNLTPINLSDPCSPMTPNGKQTVSQSLPTSPQVFRNNRPAPLNVRPSEGAVAGAYNPIRRFSLTPRD